jgi:PucR C-terminal helix-turn-helix domain
VHRNTLLHRINRIETLTGFNLKDQEDRTLVLLAVIWGNQSRTRPARHQTSAAIQPARLLALT